MASDAATASSLELIGRIKGGEREALESLLARLLPSIGAFVRLRMSPALRARESESDIVQSACREVLENLDRFTYGGEAGFRAWFYRKTLQKLRDRERHHLAERRDVRREAVPTPTPTGDESCTRQDPGPAYATLITPSRKAMVREEQELMERLFDGLREVEKDVIVLRDGLGLPWKEVCAHAQELEPGVKEEALKKRYARAKAELWEQWHERRA